ncbi:zinc ribbon domain-containing protein [Halomonas sp. CH40]|uniref:Zinc ribbon domain-containing protein n=1 Tax=Vreelandella azerica TaxID=2732867 RepID=A0A7Y3XBW2_9GAMM|nr:zinc ribbon domain-containing protein [Halomonas azerica]NOG32774.1 zinc ribbon domain-containing protein [Halomonas azerica]
MPIYEYECKACGQRLEKLQKMSADPLTQCPECKQDTLSRLVSAAGFRLAGGGWYETDFKTGSKKNLVADKSDGTSTQKTSTDKGSAKNSDAAA